jgi:hypothetical protein
MSENATVGCIGRYSCSLFTMTIRQPSSPPDQLRVYRDYAHTTVIDHTLTESTTILALLKSIVTIIPHAGPLLSGVFGITLTLIGIVNQIRDSRDDCNHLIERILRFLKNLLEESQQTSTRVENGTPTAVRVFNLLEYVIIVWSDMIYLIYIPQCYRGYHRGCYKVERLAVATKI